MPSSRPKVVLDEQSFQDMLAAAFTIQEHNAQRQKTSRAPARACGQCGAETDDDAMLCGRCAEEPRPGEELQRKWASLWLMSQEQNLGPEDFSSVGMGETDDTTAGPRSERRFLETREGSSAVELSVSIEESHGVSQEIEPILVPWMSAPGEAEGNAEQESAALQEVVEPPPAGPRNLRLRLRFHRADFYLVVAIAVSTCAMVWVLSATPAPGGHRKPRLRPWERALISLGLAEAPEPPLRRGNPNISVWVDPKTALYYCAGEELYGKAPGGHLATQREAQLDQFEPAGRAACE